MKAKTKDSAASLPRLGTKPQHLPATLVGKLLDSSVLWFLIRKMAIFLVPSPKCYKDKIS